MGIDVQLRDEKGEVLGEVSDSDMVLSRAAGRQLSDTRLLRYVVPWGDAVFNQAQAEDLLNDIAGICRHDEGSPVSLKLREVQPLVERLSTETHVYLWFIGD